MIATLHETVHHNAPRLATSVFFDGVPAEPVELGGAPACNCSRCAEASNLQLAFFSDARGASGRLCRAASLPLAGARLHGAPIPGVASRRGVARTHAENTPNSLSPRAVDLPASVSEFRVLPTGVPGTEYQYRVLPGTCTRIHGEDTGVQYCSICNGIWYLYVQYIQ